MQQSGNSRSDDTGVEQMVDAVRRFVREVLIPAEPQAEEDDDIPKHITDKLGEPGLFGMTMYAVSERIRAQAYDTWTLSPEEFTAFLRTDYAKWGKVVKLSGAKAD